MVYRLHVRRTGRGDVLLALSWGWRLFFAVLAGSAVVFHLWWGPLGAFGWGVTVLCILAALYHEEWSICGTADGGPWEITGETGLVIPRFLRMRRRHENVHLESVTVRTRAQFSSSRDTDLYRRSSSVLHAVQRGYVQLTVDGSEGQVPMRILITTESLRHRGVVQRLGEELAQVLSIPLHS